MQSLRRIHEEQARPVNREGGSDSGDLLRETRSAADRMLAAGDEAIRRALSRDAHTFLRQGRQEGGE